jgi:hypothetical protein
LWESGQLKVDHEENQESRPLNVVVITSAGMGVELAGKLALLPEIRSLTVVTTRVMRVRVPSGRSYAGSIE